MPPFKKPDGIRVEFAAGELDLRARFARVGLVGNRARDALFLRIRETVEQQTGFDEIVRRRRRARVGGGEILVGDADFFIGEVEIGSARFVDASFVDGVVPGRVEVVPVAADAMTFHVALIGFELDLTGDDVAVDAGLSRV